MDLELVWELDDIAVLFLVVVGVNRDDGGGVGGGRMVW